MILRTLTTALLFLAIQSVLAEEPKQENKAQVFQISCDIKGGSVPDPRLFVVDGELLVYFNISKVPEPETKGIEGDTIALFELRDTPKGQLIVIRSSVNHQQPKGKNLDLEGYCVTADYSNMPPSIKLTKEPEKYSYWKIPMDNKGPIVNLSDFKKPAYLSVGPQIIKLKFPTNTEQIDLEFLKVNLSLEPKDQFQARKPYPSKPRDQ